jgi:hypothetical protein
MDIITLFHGYLPVFSEEVCSRHVHSRQEVPLCRCEVYAERK